jgi:hypothetical protein
MRSALHGTSISDVEVTNVAIHGFWLLVDNREFFLPYKQFPWFRHATIHQIVKIKRFGREHLHWPDLDVDLTVDSIEHPERYPLVSKAQPSRPRPRSTLSRGETLPSPHKGPKRGPRTLPERRR